MCIRDRCIRWWPTSAVRRGNFGDPLLWAMKKRLNQSRCSLGCGLGWAKGSMYQMGCTLAPPPREYDWTVCVRWWCGFLASYFDLLFCVVFANEFDLLYQHYVCTWPLLNKSLFHGILLNHYYSNYAIQSDVLNVCICLCYYDRMKIDWSLLTMTRRKSSHGEVYRTYRGNVVKFPQLMDVAVR